MGAYNSSDNARARARTALQAMLARRDSRTQTRLAVAGDGAGHLSVPGREYYYFARIGGTAGDVAEVRSDVLAPTYGNYLLVKPERPTGVASWVVVGYTSGVPGGEVPIGKHALRHFSGDDPFPYNVWSLRTADAPGGLALPISGDVEFVSMTPATLEITGDGSHLYFSVSGGTGAPGPGGGHTIQEDGSDLSQRTALNFKTGLVASDNAGADASEVDADWATTEIADVAAVEAAGDSNKVPRGNHIHAHGTGYLPDAHHAYDHSHAGTAGNAQKLAQANTHETPDTDAATTSLHHTIGTGANQSAAGDHDHSAGGFIRSSIFTLEGALAVRTGTLRLPNHFGGSMTISGVYLWAATAPTGAAITVDIHKNGTTIFTNQAHRPSIAAGANSGSTTTIDVATWADGEYITMDVDAIGSTVAGADLTVLVLYTG